MTHFACTVIHKAGQSVEELLAPYDVDLEVEPYLRFGKRQAVEYARKYLVWPGNEPEDDDMLLALFEELEGCTVVNGCVYSTFNRNGKWDWYEIGGRFSGLLRLKNGERADHAEVGAVDFLPDPDKHERALHYWDVVVEHKPIVREDIEYFNLYSEEYYRRRYRDREDYARQIAAFGTFAVVLPDGSWHEPGQTIDLGIKLDLPKDEHAWVDKFCSVFIKTVDPEWQIAVVDCHC